MKTRLIWILLGLSAVLCLSRFFDLNSASFIWDEPHLQLLLDGHLGQHTFPVIGLLGSHGIHYGPTALWIYYPMRLITDHVNGIIFYFAALFVAGFAVMVATVWKSAGREVAAWTAAFIASSPYLFFYSRSAWDNTFLLLLIALTCFLVVRLDERHSYVDWALLGVVSGLTADLHLMALPVLAAAALTLMPTLIGRFKESARARRESIGGVAAAVLICEAIVLPYVNALRGELGMGGGQFSLLMPGFGWGLKYTPRYFSWSGMGYFLEGPKDAPELIFSKPMAMLYKLDPSILLKVAGWCLLAVTGGKLMKRSEKLPTLQRMGFLSFVLLMLYYGGLSMDMQQPHYFMPIWWVMLFFGALSIVKSQGNLRIGLTAAGILTVLMNIYFVFSAHAWIADHHGTRGTHYAPVHAELQRVVREVCADANGRHPGSRVGIPVFLNYADVIGVFPDSIEYYFRHEEGCAGKVSSKEMDEYLPPGSERYRLRYKDPNDELSAALSWRHVD